MLGTTFYHGTIRKYVASFGTLFNNINVQHIDASGNVAKTIKVPLSFSPKQRWYTKLNQEQTFIAERADTSNPEGNVYAVGNVLPRMGFNIVSYTYDSTRKTNTLHQHINYTDEDELNWSYQRVPYTFGFELYVASKKYDDYLQIIEQVLPFFTPEFSIAVDEIPELDLTSDINIVFTGLSPEIEYEGPKDSDQRIEATLSFDLKGYMYKPVTSQQTVISQEINLYSWNPDTDIAEWNSTQTTTVDGSFNVDVGVVGNG